MIAFWQIKVNVF